MSLDQQEIKNWMEKNLVGKDEGAKITEQSKVGFSQSVKMGKIVPFFETNGSTSSNIRLYLKSDLEYYRDTRQRKK